jgi:biotin carboxyl carrier protein
VTFEIEIHGRTRRIAIEPLGAAGPDGGRFAIRIDDAPPVEVSARPTDLGLSLVFDDGRSLDAAVTTGSAGSAFVQFPHAAFDTLIDGRRRRSGDPGGAAGTGEQRLLAPMPGKIVRILARVGDEVAPRQGLVVIEAMKMENELAAARAGRVREIAVAEGASVEAGRLLVVVE